MSRYTERNQRMQDERIANSGMTTTDCMECDRSFIRIGSHVVQKHGYRNAEQYRRKYGLTRAETTAPEHSQEMREKFKDNGITELGKATRFKKDGRSSKIVKEFWRTRKENL